MNKRIYAVYHGYIPEEVTQLLGSKLNNLLSLNPTIKIRARQGVHLEKDQDEHREEKIYPLMGPKLDLMALNPKPEIEIVLGDWD